MFNISRNHQTFPSRMPPAIYESCGCCTSFSFFFVAILPDVLWYHYDFNVCFPDVPLVSSFMSFSPFINLHFEVLVKVFCLFFIGLFIFLLLICRGSLYISYLDVNFVSDMSCEYFFPDCGLVMLFLLFWCTVSFNFDRVYCINYFMVHILCPTKYLPTSKPWRYSPVVSCKGSILTTIT